MLVFFEKEINLRDLLIRYFFRRKRRGNFGSAFSNVSFKIGRKRPLSIFDLQQLFSHFNRLAIKNKNQSTEKHVASHQNCKFALL
jgi:hypothetical protein